MGASSWLSNMRRTSDLESIARRSLLLLILLLSVTVGGSEAAGIEPVLRIVGPTEPLLFFAWSIANAGDFNGDGYDDLVVHGSSETIPAHGRVYFGGPAADAVEDILLLQDPGLYVSHPVEVATAGDMNGDGFSDIVVPTPSSPIHGGQARIYFGGRIPDGVADLRLRDITFDFLSFPAENAAAADFNGDGFDDVLLGAPGYVDQNENFEDTKGRAYLFLGGATPDGDPDLIFESPSNQAVGEYFIRFGGVVAPAGDLNGDAFGDFLVAPRGGPYPLGFAKAFVYLGGARLDSIPDASIITEPESDQRGRGPVMTAAGDLNADGLNDVAMLAKVDNTRHDPVHV